MNPHRLTLGLSALSLVMADAIAAERRPTERQVRGGYGGTVTEVKPTYATTSRPKTDSLKKLLGHGQRRGNF